SEFTQSDQADVKADIQKVMQLKIDRNEIKQIQMSKTHRTQSVPKKSISAQLFRTTKGFVPVKAEFDTTMMDTLVIDFIEPDTIWYIGGDAFVFQIFSMDTVLIEFYVDDGDSIFDVASDFKVDMEDMDDMEEIKVWDGIEFDESPPGDGLFQATINTSSMDEGPGPFLGLQNAVIFVYAEEVTSELSSIGTAYIGAPDENTSIEGTVTVEDVPIKTGVSPASNLVVFAFQFPDFGPMPPKGEDDWEPQIGFLTMTNDTGYYKIEIPDMFQGQYIIGVVDIWQQYPGYFPDPEFMEMPIMGDIPGVDFVLREATEKIYGYVLDELENPVPGIHIWAEGPSGIEAVTDGIGYYELPVVPGWWRVEIERDDIYGIYMMNGEQHLEVFADGDHPADFVLYSLNASFTGFIGTPDGLPIPDVEVDADIWMGDKSGSYWNYTRTDEFGNYELSVSTALQGQLVYNDWGDTMTTSYWVGAWMEGAIITPDGYHEMYAPAPGLDFTVLISDAMLSGIVYDAVSQNPLYDAGIRVWMPMPDSGKGPDGYMPMYENWAYTDENGYYELPLIGGPPPDGNTWHIEVYWPWEWMPSVFDSLNVVSGNNYSRDYYIDPPVTNGIINGNVFDENGYGISNARVEIYGPEYYELYTDGGGYFYIDQIPFGWYSATAYAEGYEPYNIWDIWVGQEPTYLEFWMGSIVGDIIVEGFVTSATTSEPIQGAILMAIHLDFYEPFMLFTDTTGHYELKVRPGFYDFQVGGNGYLAQFHEGVDVVNDTTINFALDLATIADTLSGNVVDDMNNPLRKVFIYLESDNYIGYTHTDFMGYYEIGLPTGKYDAMYAKKGFNPEGRSFNFPTEVPEDPIMLYPEIHVFGPKIIDVMDVPMDHGKKVRLTWKRAEGLQGAVKEYQIWRAIKPMYGPEPQPEFDTGWDYITTVPVHPEMDIYNVVVHTLYDKVGDNFYWSGFTVTAIGWDNWSYWNSNIRAGWSEDNLPPETPTGLTATGSEGSIALNWEAVTSEKVKYYSIYRKTATSEFSIVGYSTVPEFTDDAVFQTEVYTYTVTATDFGLNESDRAVPLSLSATAVEEVVELPTEFALKPNYPNPFNPETTIEFALPKTSKVTLTIYNLTGQLIQELVKAEYSAGYQRVIWNGRDFNGNSVGSGVYIYTLKADNFSQTRKMILMR
ncbi:MAG: carboxypeptidase regulatory-like domain-containing protein, partial [Candidatus Marinimicrobia bacterium]|nr:carboxypeptidase regulatory-like domain-containing protein [Candidatus Neomarinimicrobiota bacterium]